MLSPMKGLVFWHLNLVHEKTQIHWLRYAYKIKSDACDYLSKLSDVQYSVSQFYIHKVSKLYNTISSLHKKKRSMGVACQIK